MEIEIIKSLQSINSNVFDIFCKTISHFANYIGFIFVFLILFTLVHKKYSVYFALTYGLSILANFILKYIINRPRPYMVDSSIKNILPGSGASMPSGHTLSATIIVCFCLFAILKKEDQIEVADIFGTTPEVLQDILIILSNYRNLCAHEDIVFEHRTERVIPDTKYHEEMNIPKMDGEYIYGKNDLFAVIIIFKILLNEKNFRLMMKEIEYEIELLDGKIDTIEIDRVLDRMGFPEDYMNIIGR